MDSRLHFALAMVRFPCGHRVSFLPFGLAGVRDGQSNFCRERPILRGWEHAVGCRTVGWAPTALSGTPYRGCNLCVTPCSVIWSYHYVYCTGFDPSLHSPVAPYFCWGQRLREGEARGHQSLSSILGHCVCGTLYLVRPVQCRPRIGARTLNPLHARSVRHVFSSVAARPKLFSTSSRCISNGPKLFKQKRALNGRNAVSTP